MLVGCINGCKEQDTEYTDEELVNPESVMAYEENDTLVLRKIPPGLQEWLGYYGRLDKEFQLRNFKASGISLHLDSLPDALSKGNENAFKDLFSYSSDSMKYIDLFSYTYLKEGGNSKPVLISGDPDQQVVIADSKNRLKKQLMYHGPTQLAEIADWTTNESFLIGFTSRIEGHPGLQAEIYFFNLKDSSFTNFLLNHNIPDDSLRHSPGGFLESYFRKKNYQVK